MTVSLTSAAFWSLLVKRLMDSQPVIAKTKTMTPTITFATQLCALSLMFCSIMPSYLLVGRLWCQTTELAAHGAPAHPYSVHQKKAHRIDAPFRELTEP